MTTRVVLSSLGGINELRRPSPPHTHGGGAGGFGMGSPIRKHISILISHFLSMFSIFLYIYVLHRRSYTVPIFSYTVHIVPNIISIIIYNIYFAYFAYRAAMGMPIFCLYFACVAYYTRRQNMQNHFPPCLNQNPGK